MNRSSGRSWLWLLGGVLLGFGIVSLPSIGLLVLPVAALVILASAVWARPRDSSLALVGASLPFLYVAFRHRGGPGRRCGEGDGFGWCAELLDPRPWLVIGLAFLVLGAGLFLANQAWTRRRRRQEQTSEAGRTTEPSP